MANEILDILARINLAAAAAIVLVLVWRKPLRRMAGAKVAYALWLAVPAAALASLLPARKIFAPLPAVSPVHLPMDAGLAAAGTGLTVVPVPAAAPFDWTLLWVAIWGAGAVAGLVWLAWRQHRFLANVGRLKLAGQTLRAERSAVGPAVIGVLKPRILVPSDFEDRFNDRERAVVMAHEKVHLDQGDAQINAAVLLAQCLNWFNPLIHVAARSLRLDQELACDAAVMARFPKAKRSYAEAMLKSQLSAPDLPLGCYWPAKGPSALRQRLALLNSAPPARTTALAGAGLAVLLTVGAGVAAWAAQPPQTVYRPTPATDGKVERTAAQIATPQSQRPALQRVSYGLTPSKIDAGKAVELKAARLCEFGADVYVELRYENGKPVVVGKRNEFNGVGLQTSVVQKGARVEVFAILTKDGKPIGRGSATVKSGVTGNILTLDNGDRLMLSATVVEAQAASAAPVQAEATPADEYVATMVQTNKQTRELTDGKTQETAAELTAKRAELVEQSKAADARLELLNRSPGVPAIGVAGARIASDSLHTALASMDRGLSDIQKASDRSRTRCANGCPEDRVVDPYAGNRNAGPAGSITLPFSGPELGLYVNADVVYQPGPASRVEITGPQSELDNVKVEDGAIRYKTRSRGFYNTENTPRLSIRVTAPNVTEFTGAGSQSLTVVGYRGDKITVTLSGAGLIKVNGSARLADVKLSGAGKIDLAGLTLSEADMVVTGAGTIVAGPRERAEAKVSGVGSIDLTVTPASLSKRVTGVGSIKLPGSASSSSSSSSSAWASASPDAPIKTVKQRTGDAAQPKRDPAVLEPGTKVRLTTEARLPSGRVIGGHGIFEDAYDVDGDYKGDRHYSMASSVTQVGNTVEVRPRLMLDGKLIGEGRSVIPSGETRTVSLSNGQAVTVTATIIRSRAWRS